MNDQRIVVDGDPQAGSSPVNESTPVLTTESVTWSRLQRDVMIAAICLSAITIWLLGKVVL